MDELDRQIIAALQEDGRLGYRELARDLDVSPGTIRIRVKQLTEDGLIRVIAVPTSKLLAQMFQATIGLRLSPGNAQAVSEILTERPEVGWVGLAISGSYDVLFEVILGSSTELGPYREDFLAQLPGCLDIDVFVMWDIPKFGYDVASAYAALNGEAAAVPHA